MKKTFNVDPELLRQAKEACGASTDTDALRLGLQALVRHAAHQRLAALRGSEPDALENERRILERKLRGLKDDKAPRRRKRT